MRKLMLLGFIAAMMMAGGGAYGQEGKAASPKSGKKMARQPTPEQRQAMASIHDKMAECLRSDKTVEQCHAGMRAQCKEMDGGCPMMGMGRHHPMMEAEEPEEGGL